MESALTKTFSHVIKFVPRPNTEREYVELITK